MFLLRGPLGPDGPPGLRRARNVSKIERTLVPWQPTGPGAEARTEKALPWGNISASFFYCLFPFRYSCTSEEGGGYIIYSVQ